MIARRRAPAALLLALAVPLLGAKPMPDLAVPRADLRRDGKRIACVVENLGDAPSPPTTLLLTDRSPLGGSTGGSALYPFTPNRKELAIYQEPAGKDSIALSIGLGAGVDGAASSGRIRFDGASGTPVLAPQSGVRMEGGDVVAWDSPPPGGRLLRILVPARGGVAPRATVDLDWKMGDLLPVVLAPQGEVPSVSVPVILDALRRDPARRVVLPVKALDPGERCELSADMAGGIRDAVFAWVDPDDRIREVREGNNVACWHEDRDRVTLAALHLHSSFSEGAGSVDWQVLLAAASGYDLLWWSEHDWRLACRDHVASIGFEPGEDLDLDYAGTTEGASAGPTSEDAEHGLAMRLAVPRGQAGTAVATITDARKRMTYSLAAEITLEMRVLARGLDRGDRFALLAELSHHPGEKRRIEYSFRWEGTPAEDRDASDGVRRVVPRTLPTGSWVDVEIPLSQDAAEIWPNGLDDNVQGLRLSLRSAGSAASVLVDDVRIRAERCGASLRAVQESWMPDYPNVDHLFADEVSYSRPHLNEYGGPRGLFDFEAAWNETRVGSIAERVHGAGGIIAWCHPLGIRQGVKQRDRFTQAYQDSLLDGRFGGTDLLEVGFRRKGVAPLSEYLELWDDAGKRGIVITGIGVNDSHEWDWGSWENNFATWIPAPADDATRLLAALRTGRVMLGDPLRFQGTLSIECGSAGPGDVVAGDAPREVVVRAKDAPEGAHVRLVADGTSRGEWKVERGAGRWSLRLAPGEARAVRAEAWDADGGPLAFTNPIYFDAKGTMRRP
ncbi:MAG: hypothetical protein U0167_18430 [bacterium]